MDSSKDGAPAGAVRVDAKTFQEPLDRLCNTMVQVVFREGTSHAQWPQCVSEDIAMMLRYSVSVYNLQFYLNADVRREKDTEWRMHYGVTAISLIRSLIDCLYNITAILENPATVGPKYRKCGFKKMLEELDEDQERYAGQEAWESYIQERRDKALLLIRASGFTEAEVEAETRWPTFGNYLGTFQSGGVKTPNQEFLKSFTYLNWRQYSALSHAVYDAFAGTIANTPLGAYYMKDFFEPEVRPKIEEGYPLVLSQHVGRAATVLLCIITEIQAYCHFEGHNINERICSIWAALQPMFETKELYDGRYRKLIAERGILIG